MTKQRVRFRDLKPYSTVDSLDELAGPGDGTVALPRSIFWSKPSNTFDIGSPRERAQAYSALLTNGRPPQLREFVNRQLLIEDWPKLRLDQRIVDLWTVRHPELAGVKREW